MSDKEIGICVVLVIIITFVVLGVVILSFIFPSTMEVSIEEVEEEVEEVELIGTYTGGFLVLYKLHDNKDNVTCWVYTGGQRGGISCIPDHLLSP